jgi:hypothetical protein
MIKKQSYALLFYYHLQERDKTLSLCLYYIYLDMLTIPIKFLLSL